MHKLTHTHCSLPRLVSKVLIRHHYPTRMSLSAYTITHSFITMLICTSRTRRTRRATTQTKTAGRRTQRETLRTRRMMMGCRRVVQKSPQSLSIRKASHRARTKSATKNVNQGGLTILQHVPNASQRLLCVLCASDASPSLQMHPRCVQHVPFASDTFPMSQTRPLHLQRVPYASNLSHTPLTPPSCLQHVPDASNASPTPPRHTIRFQHALPLPHRRYLPSPPHSKRARACICKHAVSA
ncbi:hypothetical protein OG21DRAFT_543109 [Imleria badia]|nr:hypothetical protein OG21DRAFT_543109 [Imleria badia]